MRKWQKKTLGLSIEELTEQNENVVGLTNVDRTNLGRGEIKDWRAYGTTFVNLLGNYGNFENDTDGDGLADGWTNDGTLTAVTNALDTSNKTFGSKCQKITLDANGEGGNYIEVDVSASESLFVAGYAEVGDTDTTAKILIDWRDGTDTQISTSNVDTNATTSWVRLTSLLTAPASTEKARIYILVSGDSAKYAYFDGVQVHNMTEQGTLDSARADKYSETNWADLTATQLEAEIPYFDSVMSVNYDTTGSSDVEIENRGKNLFPFAKSYSSAPTEINYHFEDYLSFLTVGETYTLSFYVDKPTAENAYFAWYIGGTNYTTGRTGPSGRYSLSFTLSKRLEVYSHTLAFRLRFANYNEGTISDIQLEEGSEATEYEDPRTDKITIPSTVELHGFSGAANSIDKDGNYLKYWVSDDKTTNASGEFTMSGYESGSKVICRNKSNGEVAIKDAADTVTTDWESTDIEILYQLDDPVTSDVSITNALGPLHKTDNNFVPTIRNKTSFTGDGYTTVFNTSFTPAKVCVNGLDVTSDVTLNSDNVTFSTAPRRKAIIDVYSDSLTGAQVSMQMDVLKASETVDTVSALTDLSITENEESVGYVNVDGSALKKVGNKTYTVTLNKDLIEDQDNILDGYRDKKFRLKVTNPRDSTTEYLGVCHIDPDASKDYLNGTESITIKCGDLYD